MTLFLVIIAALLSLQMKPVRPPVARQPTAQEALRSWFQEHASEFDNFSKRGKPVDLAQDGPCYFCAWFCAWQSSANEYLYRVGLAEEMPQTSCRMGETVRVFRQGPEWEVEPTPSQVSVGNPSWQELVVQLRRKFVRPEGVETKVLLEKEDVVVVMLVESNIPLDVGAPDRYRFRKGVDQLWRGYAPVEPSGGRYAEPEDMLIDFALSHFPTLSTLGDCVPAPADGESGRVCWTRKNDADDRRTYVIGPAPSPETVVAMRRRDAGWELVPVEQPAQ